MWVSDTSQYLLSSVISVFVRLFSRLLDFSMTVFSSLCAFSLPGDPCLTVRAYRKIQELQHLLEIAYSNYRQLGGITEEEKKMKKEQREVEK